MKLPRWTSLILVVAWILHAYTKVQDGILPEMFWGCHVATLVIAAGIAMRSVNVAAVGFIFHAAAGFPGYIVYVVYNGLQPTSIFIHGGSVILGALAVRDVPWSVWAAFGAWALNQVLVVLSYFLTDPAMNINMAHAPFAAVQPWIPQVWMSWFGNAALMAGTVALAHYALKRWWLRVI